MAITPVTIQTAAEQGKVLDPVAFQADLDNMETAINAIIATMESLANGVSGGEYVKCRSVDTLNSSTGGTLYVLLLAMYTEIKAIKLRLDNHSI